MRVASATSEPAEVGPVDLVIVALKAWQLRDLDMRPLVRLNTPVCVSLLGAVPPARCRPSRRCERMTPRTRTHKSARTGV